MLKLFRKYNKYILAFGASILMVAFLVQGTISMWMPSGRSTPVGTFDHGKIAVTVGDRQTAAVEMDILRQFGLTRFPPFARQVPTDENLRFYLLTYEAKQLGLSASQAEVDIVLQAVGVGKAQVAQIINRYRVTSDFIDQAVRHWLMIQTYRDLALGHGLANFSLQSSAPGLRMIELHNQFYAAEKNKDRSMANAVQSMMQGAQRVSRPLVRHFLQDVFSRATGNLILVDSQRYLPKVARPSQKQLEQLFNQYKSALPGHADPYGFGYRIPNRVKLDYLAVPLSEVRKTIDIGEASAISYYDQHKEQFTRQPATASTQPATRPTQVQPYSAVRDRIIKQLRDDKARQIASRMIKTAQSLMLSDVRKFGIVAGYRKLPKNYKPITLQAIADQLQQQFHIKPVVYRDDKKWISAEQLGKLPIIGNAQLGSGRNAHSFRQYVLSAKQFNPSTDNPLVARRLQVNVPSDPLSTGQAQIIFRLTAAEPTREPASLDAVRAQVVIDARKLDAYHLLLGEKPKLLTQVASHGITKVADDLKLTVLPFKQLPRRQMFYGRLFVPYLPGVGQRTRLVDDIFAVAYRASRQQNQGDFASVPRRERIGGVGIPAKLSLALFQIDKYHQISHKQFRRYERSPDLAVAVSNAVQAASAAQNPLSLEAIKARLNFKEAGIQAQPETPANVNQHQTIPG